MSGSDDLRSKLSSLARTDEAFVDGERVISKGGLPTPLQSILTEISETVLTRDLRFRFGESGSIDLVVSGRRLLGVRGIDGLAMPAIVRQLSGQQITGEDDPHLRALVGILLPLDLLTDTVTTTSTSVEWKGAETGTGVSAERLAARLSVPFPIVPVTRMSQFKSRLGHVAVASVQRLASHEEVTEGGEADLDWLFAQAGPFLATVRPESDAPKMAILGQVIGTGRVICAAFDTDESLIWWQDGSDATRICTMWREIFLA